ncbi:MAG: universal stress protein [Omnitrophica WOR_2 bacterium]
MKLTPDIKPEELILKAEYNDFLEHTHLNTIRPDADLTLTVPGQYPILEEHISVHRYYMGLEQKREISSEQAVAHWYDTVYLPVKWMISERGILRDFPGRTEADLYLWIAEHRASLEKVLESEVKPEDAARDFADEFSPRPVKVAARLGEKIIGAIIPDTFEGGPPAGQWRLDKMKSPLQDRLFTDILVPVNGQESGWYAVEQAIILSRRENSRLHGLHVVPTIEDKNNKDARAIQAEFKRRCEAAGVAGSLVIASGEVTRQICDRSRWNDLILLNLMYPPASRPLNALTSSFRNMIQRCPKPVLSVPEEVTSLSKALIAYDGSPKAEEALYVATYISGKWMIPLNVVYVVDGGSTNEETLLAAQQYLESHDIKATYFTEHGSVPEMILKVAAEQSCDFILMGGYGRNPVLDVVLGSTVDHVLRESNLPVLFCR